MGILRQCQARLPGHPPVLTEVRVLCTRFNAHDIYSLVYPIYHAPSNRTEADPTTWDPGSSKQKLL
jgi:hypothetical protein